MRDKRREAAGALGRNACACAAFLACALVACRLIANAHAEDFDPDKDALIVETLLRLDPFDLEAKPKTKAAVLRYLKANPGNDAFFQLIERFAIKDAGDTLVELAIAKPAETANDHPAWFLEDDPVAFEPPARRQAAVPGGAAPAPAWPGLRPVQHRPDLP